MTNCKNRITSLILTITLLISCFVISAIPASAEGDTGSYTHNFTTDDKSSTFFTITGNLSTDKGEVEYNGLTLTQCLMMEDSTSISFTAEASGTLTLVFGGTTNATGKTIKIDGVKNPIDSTQILTVDVVAGDHTITKNNPINLFYMSFTYTTEGSGNEGGGNEGSGNGGSDNGGGDNGGGDNGGGGNTEETTKLFDVEFTHNFSGDTNNDGVDEIKDGNFNISGNLATGKGDVSYDGLTLTQCLKIESSTQISFEAPASGKLTLVFKKPTKSGASLYVYNGTKTEEKDITGTNDTITVILDLEAETTYTITRKSVETYLYYMSFSPTESYDSIDKALTAASNGGTVSLNSDIDLDGKDLEIPDNATLDLNGHNLTANGVVTFGYGEQLIDTAKDKGLILVGHGNLIYNNVSENGSFVPVWSETRKGYVLADVVDQYKGSTSTEDNKTVVEFRPAFVGIDHFDEFADGVEDNDLTFKVRVTVSEEDVREYEVPPEVIMAAYTNKYTIRVTLVNANLGETYKIELVIEYAKGVTYVGDLGSIAEGVYSK